MALPATGIELTIAGVPLRVRQNTWVRHPDVYQGERLRMADQNVVSTEYGGIKVADCEVYFLDYAEEQELRLACPRGQAVLVTGRLTDVGFQALVDIGQSVKKNVKHEGVWGLHRVVSIHIEQDEPL